MKYINIIMSTFIIINLFLIIFLLWDFYRGIRGYNNPAMHDAVEFQEKVKK